MSGETPITYTGNLVADPEMRFTASGVAVANFRMASTPRTFDKSANEWKDGEALFLDVAVWREQAEHVVETLHRGDRAIVVGRLGQRQYTDREGNKRTVYEITADEVGPSLIRATAQITKANSSNTRQQQRPTGNAWGQQNNDPWAQ
jgi:single-strand DNA-binding protein